MEAKTWQDTVISKEQMRDIILKGWCSPETKPSDIFPEPWDYAIAQAQAEISFKAGRKAGSG